VDCASKLLFIASRRNAHHVVAPSPLVPRPSLLYVLVACAVATIYITQPVLPILQREFAVTPAMASLSVSMVILGMAATTLPIGILADRYPLRRLIAIGGCVIASAGIGCAVPLLLLHLSRLPALQRFEKADDILLATNDDGTRTGHLIRQRHEAIGDRQGFTFMPLDRLHEAQGLAVVHQTIARADAPERRCAHFVAR